MPVFFIFSSKTLHWRWTHPKKEMHLLNFTVLEKSVSPPPRLLPSPTGRGQERRDWGQLAQMASSSSSSGEPSDERGAGLISSTFIQGARRNCACKFPCGLWRWGSLGRGRDGEGIWQPDKYFKLGYAVVYKQEQEDVKNSFCHRLEIGSFPRARELVKTLTTKTYNESHLFCCSASLRREMIQT